MLVAAPLFPLVVKHVFTEEVESPGRVKRNRGIGRHDRSPRRRPSDHRRTPGNARGTKKKRIGPHLMSSDRIRYKQLNPKAL